VHRREEARQYAQDSSPVRSREQQGGSQLGQTGGLQPVNTHNESAYGVWELVVGRALKGSGGEN
jgi:hypothetical protein